MRRYDMRKKLKFGSLILGCLIGIAALWLSIKPADHSSDQAHRRDWQRYGRRASMMNSLEHLIGGNAASILGVMRLERSYQNKSTAEMAALVRSGYLVRVQFPVTNLA